MKEPKISSMLELDGAFATGIPTLFEQLLSHGTLTIACELLILHLDHGVKKLPSSKRDFDLMHHQSCHS